MTEKRNPNPFIRMAQEAKERTTKITPEKAKQVQQAKAPKANTKGFGNSVMRKTGRGG
jgi:hypothetical protein